MRVRLQTHSFGSGCAQRRNPDRGFTLVELASVVLVMGLIFAFAVPSFQSMRRTMDLKATRDNIANQMQLARAKAIATGVNQPIHFNSSFGYDYHLHPAGATNIQGWNLPQGVSYEWPSGSPLQVTMMKDGSASTNGVSPSSFMVPLANARGQRDTVQVLASGMVISQ